MGFNKQGKHDHVAFDVLAVVQSLQVRILPDRLLADNPAQSGFLVGLDGGQFV